MSALRVIFAGSGEFGVPTLRALIESEHEVITVISQPDRPAGRGRGMTPTAIAKLALEVGVKVIRTERINAEPLPPADLMVVIAFGQKISAEKVNHARLGSVNLHASRLPLFRGAAPINWAILSGQAVTGNSVIRLADKMDAGAILAQSVVQIGELETAGELHDRLAIDGVNLVMDVARDLSTGAAFEAPQDESKATIAPKLSRESARLDFSRPAEELARKIRGLYPWPGCCVRVVDESGVEVGRMRPIRARARPDSSHSGQLGDITELGFVQTGVGLLELVECQPDGGKPMAFEDYRRGHRWGPGLRLESPD
jgi:methionyl-tRNA formyltransferase